MEFKKGIERRANKHLTPEKRERRAFGLIVDELVFLFDNPGRGWLSVFCNSILSEVPSASFVEVA